MKEQRSQPPAAECNRETQHQPTHKTDNGARTMERNLLYLKSGILDEARRRPHRTSLGPFYSFEGRIVKTLLKLKASGAR